MLLLREKSPLFCGKNRFLQPENFNIEMNLKFNLGPLHLLDNFVKEILASDSTKSYLRKKTSQGQQTCYQ